jgi:N-acetylglutamate synthase-like GNAT family acetyltransferase
MEISIREFMAGDANAFRRLNEEWITRFFKLEDKDIDMLANPQRTILDDGGKILMAFQDGEAVGCCALIRIAPGEFEVAKMAVTPTAQGKGMGRKLLAKTIEVAAAAGATRLYLVTHDSLTPAIRLYESLGFKHLPPERVVPSVYERANVFMELPL